MKPDRTASRRDDMTQQAKLTVMLCDDGDVIIGILNSEAPGGTIIPLASVEFCELGSGGGRSEHTRDALIALIDAIDKDNAERPLASAASAGGDDE